MVAQLWQILKSDYTLDKVVISILKTKLFKPPQANEGFGSIHFLITPHVV